MLLVKIAVAICHNGISNDIENDHDFFSAFSILLREENLIEFIHFLNLFFGDENILVAD